MPNRKTNLIERIISFFKNLSRAQNRTGLKLKVFFDIEDELRETKIFLAGIIDSVTDLLVIVNPDGTVRLVNNSALKTLGYEKKELLGRPVELIFPRQSVPALVRESIKNNKTVQDIEIRLVDRRGKEIPALFSSVVIFDEEKKVQAILFAAKDIAERKEAEQRIASLLEKTQRANEELKRLDRTKNEFLSIVTHDLKTPLVSVYGYTRLMLDGLSGKISEKQRSILEIIEKETKKLQDMIDSILDFTRMEFAEIRIRRERYPLNSQLNELVQEIKPLAGQKKLAMEVRLPPRPVLINCDKTMIGRAMSNLLNNAIKYTPEGGRIMVRLEERAGFVRLSVADSGVGVRRDHLTKLFDKFFMVEKVAAGQKRSLGLGLYIVRSFVEAHGGKVWVESAGEGRGSKFIVDLPRTAPAPPQKCH